MPEKWLSKGSSVTSENPGESTVPSEALDDGAVTDEPQARLTADEYRALPEILTPAEAARMLSVARKQPVRWAASGRIPGAKIGGTWRFSKSTLERLVDEGNLPGQRESDSTDD